MKETKYICPVCGYGGYACEEYSEPYWGIVERHNHCTRCGFTVEQAYSEPLFCFCDIVKGFKTPSGKYVEKNSKKHRRARRKRMFSNIPVNPTWSKYF